MVCQPQQTSAGCQWKRGLFKISAQYWICLRPRLANSGLPWNTLKSLGKLPSPELRGDPAYTRRPLSQPARPPRLPQASFSRAVWPGLNSLFSHSLVHILGCDHSFTSRRQPLAFVSDSPPRPPSGCFFSLLYAKIASSSIIDRLRPGLIWRAISSGYSRSALVRFRSASEGLPFPGC